MVVIFDLVPRWGPTVSLKEYLSGEKVEVQGQQNSECIERDSFQKRPSRDVASVIQNPYFNESANWKLHAKGIIKSSKALYLTIFRPHFS